MKKNVRLASTFEALTVENEQDLAVLRDWTKDMRPDEGMLTKLVEEGYVFMRPKGSSTVATIHPMDFIAEYEDAEDEEQELHDSLGFNPEEIIAEFGVKLD